MGGLSIFLEEDGFATVGISLIRIHTERTAPPRALWVPFELGRPFGVPGDSAFQHRVLAAALDLLDAPSGPLIVDYPEDVPDGAVGAELMEGMFCPIALPPPPDPDAPGDETGRALMAEIASHAPWYDLAVSQRGRTTVGPSGLTIADAARYLLRYVDDPSTPPYREGFRSGHALKLAFEDLKSFYCEAVTAQPGLTTSWQIENWLFGETALGKVLWHLRDICRASEDDFIRNTLGRNSIVPDRQINPPH